MSHASPRLWLLVVTAASALALSSSPPARASLIGPSIHGLAAGPSGVLAKVGARFLLFNHQGQFVGETQIALDVDDVRLLGVTEDGRIWLSQSREEDDNQPPATRFLVFDAGGNELARTDLEGTWTQAIAPDGSLYVGRVDDGTLQIDRLDVAAGARQLHARVPVERAARVLDLSAASAISWAIAKDGSVFLLDTLKEKGIVSHFGRGGELLARWEVVPEPLTSVAYVKDIVVDPRGGVYVTHSSWEVSASTENSGSVIKFDSAGRELFRAKEGIDYLQDVAVSTDGDIYVTDLSEEIRHFSSDGRPVGSWVAVPPRFGENWQERQERERRARAVAATADTSELINAVVYGRGTETAKAAQWLRQRGASALGEATHALLAYPESFALEQLVEQLWREHLGKAVELFEQGDEDLRRLMATALAWEVEAPSPALRDVLARMALEGDEHAEAALGEIGTPPEVLEHYLAELRRTSRTEGGSFEAEWNLRKTYAQAIATLEAPLMDPADSNRDSIRSVILEASRDLKRDATESDSAARKALPAVIARTERWLQSSDLYVRQTAAIALAGLGVPGSEGTAVEAATRTPTLLGDTLDAFAALATDHPQGITPHLSTLFGLAREAPTSCGYGPLRRFAAIPGPDATAFTLKWIRDQSFPTPRRAELLSGVTADQIPWTELDRLLAEQPWQRGMAEEPAYFWFLEGVTKSHLNEPGLRTAIRATLLARLAETRSGPPADAEGRDALARVLEALTPFATEEDTPRLLPLLEDSTLSGQARGQLFACLSRLRPTDVVRERLEASLGDPHFGLAAAQSLGRMGHPAALPILVEEGLKKLGYYSWVQLDAESFRPYGPRAETALLGLMDYPNAMTRGTVRKLLVDLGSEEGARRITREFQASLASGTAPPAYTVSALLDMGQDPVMNLVSLAVEHPELMDSLYWEHTDGERIGRLLLQNLRAETDARRATAAIALLKKADANALEAELEALRTSHPLDAVREALGRYRK